MEDPTTLDFDVNEMMSRKLAESVFNKVAVIMQRDQLCNHQLPAIWNAELAKYEKYFDKAWIDNARKFIEFKFNTDKNIIPIDISGDNVRDTALRILKSDDTLGHVVYAWENNDEDDLVHRGYFWFRNGIEFAEFCAQLYKKDVGIVKAVNRIVDL